MRRWWFLVLLLCLQLIKLMEQFPDVVFLKVNFDDNKAMCKTLGVKVRYVCCSTYSKLAVPATSYCAVSQQARRCCCFG
jgi:hypothetical protein